MCVGHEWHGISALTCQSRARFTTSAQLCITRFARVDYVKMPSKSRVSVSLQPRNYGYIAEDSLLIQTLMRPRRWFSQQLAANTSALHCAVPLTPPDAIDNAWPALIVPRCSSRASKSRSSPIDPTVGLWQHARPFMLNVELYCH